jgi:hypothetical protein
MATEVDKQIVNLARRGICSKPSQILQCAFKIASCRLLIDKRNDGIYFNLLSTTQQFGELKSIPVSELQIIPGVILILRYTHYYSCHSRGPDSCKTVLSVYGLRGEQKYYCTEKSEKESFQHA